jgi:hypothetical protein
VPDDINSANEIDQDPLALTESALVADPADVDVTPHSSHAIPAHKVIALHHAEGWWPERTAEQGNHRAQQ